MKQNNPLYPIFLKAHALDILIVGGGYVALEKLTFLFKSSPEAKVTLVSPFLREETKAFAVENKVTIIDDVYQEKYLEGRHIVIATTDNEEVNLQVHAACKAKHILVNLADNPTYCDFYMGGIVTKGNVKVAISTNGKSPTMAKRLRQFFEEVLPENIDDLAENLNEYRKTLAGGFEEKVTQLNEFTKTLLDKTNK